MKLKKQILEKLVIIKNYINNYTGSLSTKFNKYVAMTDSLKGEELLNAQRSWMLEHTNHELRANELKLPKYQIKTHMIPLKENTVLYFNVQNKNYFEQEGAYWIVRSTQSSSLSKNEASDFDQYRFKVYAPKGTLVTFFQKIVVSQMSKNSYYNMDKNIKY